MSSILKALKKVEEEKGACRGESADFARSLLRSDYRRPRSRARLLLGGIFLLVLLTVGAWWVSRVNFPPVQSPAIVAGADETGPDLPAAGPLPPTAMALQVKPAPLQTADAAVEEIIFSAPPIAAAGSRTVPLTSAPPSITAMPIPTTPQTTLGSAAEKGSTPALPVSSLSLSGIAWQEARDARLAIVDDLPVMEGTMIDGILVEEILRDRVRFSLEGQPFELLLKP